jgi:hypothetical protein
MHISQFDYLPLAPGFFSILVALFIVGLPPPYAPMDFAAWIEVFAINVVCDERICNGHRDRWAAIASRPTFSRFASSVAPSPSATLRT